MSMLAEVMRQKFSMYERHQWRKNISSNTNVGGSCL